MGSVRRNDGTKIVKVYATLFLCDPKSVKSASDLTTFVRNIQTLRYEQLFVHDPVIADTPER